MTEQHSQADLVEGLGLPPELLAMMDLPEGAIDPALLEELAMAESPEGKLDASGLVDPRWDRVVRFVASGVDLDGAPMVMRLAAPAAFASFKAGLSADPEGSRDKAILIIAEACRALEISVEELACFDAYGYPTEAAPSPVDAGDASLADSDDAS